MIVLRDYQLAAVHETRSAWAGGTRRPAIIMPTGTGKTTVFTKLADDMHAAGVERTLILAHRRELIDQAAERVRLMAPHLRVGIVKGAVEQIRGRDVIVASVQTIGQAGESGQRRRRRLREAGVRLVIVDECHHAVSDSYMRVLRDLGCFPEEYGGDAYALGVTATMTRTDKLGLGQVWEKIVYRYEVLQAIRAGHLVVPKGIRVRVAGLDLSRVKRTGGDLAAGELSEALHDALAPKAVTRAYLEHVAPRPTILFAPGVALGYEFAEALRAEGVRAIAVDGKTEEKERARIIQAFRLGEYDVVCNCGVFTEGFDAPHIECVIIARPTQSAGLYVQMAGRGLRPSPATGKTDCLIVDVVGVTGKHKLAGIASLAGAERVEELPDELKAFDDLPDEEALDLLELMDPDGPHRERWAPIMPEGPLVVETVDLFESSKHAWLQTQRGVWFLEAPGERIVFLAPSPVVGRYRVCETGHRNPSGQMHEDGLDLQTAMMRGEYFAGEAMGHVLTRRTERWRSGEPRPNQIAAAARIGMDTEGLTRGQLSDRIAVHKVSQRVDQMRIVESVTVDGYWPEPAPLTNDGS